MTIKEKFIQLNKEKGKAFVAYLPFGFPSLDRTTQIILALQDAGVDILELGVPFSDPLADGPIIQNAMFKAIENGATVENLFQCIEKIKNQIKIPIVVMTYANPFFSYGIDKFFSKMKECCLTATIVVDLPVEEAREYLEKSKKYAVETIFLVTPVTPFARVKKIIKATKGFLYYISVTGITGPREFQYAQLSKEIRKIKAITKLPVCVGFGIHSNQQVKQICEFSDGVIVGSDIVEFISKNYSQKSFLTSLKDYISNLSQR